MIEGWMSKGMSFTVSVGDQDLNPNMLALNL